MQIRFGAIVIAARLGAYSRVASANNGPRTLHVGNRLHAPSLIRLLHHVRLPQVPGPRRVAWIAVAQRAFSG